ncbi:MAG: Protein tyrosine and serine/threonine kinase, partial [Polyangiaceae bacterium]|nr:Protein tyrosine and serine/threonine kinase [Polyangiaceae bacterium]
MHLGRLTKGEDAGRFVLLRDLSAHEVQEMASEIDLARSIAHPKLLKLLGCVRSEGHTYLASEYVPGVALTEVRSALRKQRTTLPAPVAVRIALDALKASLAARELLGSATGIAASSVFHPDAIWLAEFGETLLIPAPAPPAAPGRTPYTSAAADTAPGLIMELATGLSPARLLGQGLREHLPEQLADALSKALARHVVAGDDTEAVLVDSLSQLPGELIGSEQDVESELLRLVGPRLESRRLMCAVDQ